MDISISDKGGEDCRRHPGRGDDTMKLASQNRRSAFVLILLAVLLLFTVVGFAAGESSVAEAAQNGVATLRGYINRGIEKLKDANYIGNACRSAFEGLGNIKDYWWIIIGVIALIECFFGYRLFRLELALIGFIGGFVGGLFLYPVLENLIPAMANVPAVQTIIAAILGIAGLLLTQFFFKAAVVIAVGYAGYLFSEPYLVAYRNALLFRILIAVGLAILAFLLLKVIIVLITGLFGGMLAVVQLTVKIAAIQKPLLEGNAIVSRIFGVTSKLGLGIDALTVALIIGAVIGLLGLIFQFANTARKRA